MKQSIPNGRREAPNFAANGGIPHAYDAETAILASFFSDKISVAVARDRYGITPSDFFFEPHRLTCQAIFEEFDKQRDIDTFTIAGNLSRHGQLETVGGKQKLDEIASVGAEFTHIETYAQDVKNAAVKRLAFHRAAELARMTQNGVGPADITAFLEQTAQELNQHSADIGTATRQRFLLIPAQQFKTRPVPKFLVPDLIVEGGLSAIEGKSESYKSFIAIALAGSVATGISWCGREIQQGGVVYVSGEGSSGLTNRICAWEIDNNTLLPDDFLMLPEAVQLMDVGEVGQIISAIKLSGVTPKLVVIDTLARCFVGGDENAARDMGMFIAGADAIRKAFGCSVLIVHHHGNNEKVRGSSSFPGAMDTRIEVIRKQDQVTLKCAKQKDFEHFEDIGLIRRIIQIDETRSSLVFDQTGETVKSNSNTEKAEVCYRVLLNSETALRDTEWKKLAESAGCSKSQYNRVKPLLIEQGRVKQIGLAFVALAE